MQDKSYLTSQSSVPSNESQSIHQYDSHHVLLQNSPKPDGQASAVSRHSLMSIPDESLTHITSFVADPPSLFALSRVNRRFRDHIADDNTWYRAFAFHFLDVGPESEPGNEKRLMLRRSESTWAKEYVLRFNLARRWERSRSATLNYQPHYWGVSSMHLLENVSLMTANLQYGIVTRSFPLTGKILKGYLDASGTTNGLGIGNPNEEFSPNVACIALSSCGGTGRIAWGFRNGEVAVTSAPRIMDSNRSAARYARCRVEDEHASEVRCVAFAGRDDELLVTGCADGQVKLWDTKRMQCIWTGFGKKADATVPTACVKTVFCAGVLVVALASGDIMVYWGFPAPYDDVLVDSIHELNISEGPSQNHTVDTLLVDPNSSLERAIILVHYANECEFIRLAVDLPSGVLHRTVFRGGPLGPLTSIKACFSTQSRNSSLLTPGLADGPTPSLAIALAADRLGSCESSFVLAGDSLGRVCIWNWDVDGSSSSAKGERRPHYEVAQVNSSRKWEAHEDGAICAIEVGGPVIVTGSTRGTLKVWDSLTLDPLRSFSSPVSKPSTTGEWDPVGQVVIREDLLVASVGSRILVWQAGAVTPHSKGKRKSTRKPKGKTTGNLLNKWQQQIELNRDIRESQRLLEDEREHTQRVYGRERAQLSTLDQLGLDEREAVEYLLMLSREEEEQRRALERAKSGGGGDVEMVSLATNDDMEGVFSLDESPTRFSTEDSPTLFHAPEPNNSSPSLPRFIPSNSNSKVQVSQPLPEATETGLSSSPLRLSTTPASDTTPVSTNGLNGQHNSGISRPVSLLSNFADVPRFPAMISSPSTPSRSVSSTQLAGSWLRGSPSSSYIGTSASTTRSDHTSSSTSSTSRSSSLSAQSPARDGDTTRQDRAEEEDEELKFVLALSLAEARSRGEV